MEETHGLRGEPGVAERIELARELLEEVLDLGVLLLEVLVELVDDFAAGPLLLGGRVVLLVDLGEGLVRLGVLELHEADRKSVV